ncbi:AraC family transcriptional regulator [Paraflavisolibacter sp. H34]|uniref:AraC family transcriptional regulator n=1 Tax=Huijunlia imazamoxiresistens TaxID=3127457 RepID=UPI00301A136F
MKPQIQKLPLSENSSFTADRFLTPCFETPWHYHYEYELVLILCGKGKRFVGNHVSDYEEGNLTFIGPNLPHLFRKEDPAMPGGALVIHFRKEFLGEQFPSIPEMKNLNALFQRSLMGLHLTGKTREAAGRQMQEILELQGMERLIALLRLLSLLANTQEYELLSSAEVHGQNLEDNDRLNRVFDYVMTHFREDIQLEQVAEIANMSYSGFCRYFKNRTKKNFSSFVNEIRIGYACKRLMESDSSVSDVGYDAGFNNLTNFNEHFKKIVKLTPYQFKLKNKM